MHTTDLIAEKIELYGHSKKAIWAAIGVELLAGSEALELLNEHRKIKEKLGEIVEKGKSQKKGILAGITGHEDGETLSKEIVTTAKLQGRILHCPEVDEHSLFLAVIKLLEESGEISYYKPVLKEMLQKNLHKLENLHFDVPFVGREREVAEAERVLKRSTRNNLLIVGSVGVGKTTLAKALQLKLPWVKLLQLFAGNDAFFDQIVNILSHGDLSNQIFFLDEIFTFEANQLKYLVDNAQIVGTANEVSYKKFAAEAPHIVSKFEVLNLEEPEESQVMKILTQKAEQMQASGLELSSDLLGEVYAMGKQYISDMGFPAKGINLLEELGSYAHSNGETTLTTDMLKALIAQKTNIPIASLTDFDKKDLSELAARIKKRVKGQDAAVDTVATTVQRARLGFKKAHKPIGSFLFVGPSGVGKTELAKAVAQEVFGDEEAMVRLDMSEFSEAHMVQRLIGSPPGYIGFEEGGQLTNPVKQKPYTLVLLDELEKAHPRVFDIFLQVLDDGRLTDGAGNPVDFSNAIIIATSNAGIEDMLDLLEEGKEQTEIATEIREILQDYFRIEFINRFDNIVIFNALKPKALVGIAHNQLHKLEAELAKRNIRIKVPDSLLEAIAEEAYDPRFGARGLIRLLQERIENELAEEIISGRLQDGQTYAFKEVKSPKSSIDDTIQDAALVEP